MCEKKHSRAPTARFIGPPPQAIRTPRLRWSIPHVPFIEFDVVLAQQEGFCPVMLLLRVDVNYETGRWPSLKIRRFFPGRCPWAGMSQAFGLAPPELGQMSKP